MGGLDKQWRERLWSAEKHLLGWPRNLEEARAEQKRLRGGVICRDEEASRPERIAGVDVGYDATRGLAKAAVAILSAQDLGLLDYSTAWEEIRFPYIPGYLSFREVPVAVKAMQGVSLFPDLLFCDGQGVAHPRRLGLACHLGLLLDIPSLGVAKSKLVGDHDPVGPHKGDWQPLRCGKETLGMALRSRKRTKPVYVSCGHRISLASCRELVLIASPKYKLPEPIRQAHSLARIQG